MGETSYNEAKKFADQLELADRRLVILDKKLETAEKIGKWICVAFICGGTVIAVTSFYTALMILF